MLGVGIVSRVIFEMLFSVLYLVIVICMGEMSNFVFRVINYWKKV